MLLHTSSSDTTIAMWSRTPTESRPAPVLNRVTLPAFTVLLVEPHDDTAEMYAAFFEYHGIGVISVPGATEALAAVSKTNLAVTNIALPGTIDGVELIARLRRQARTREMPVIALSARVFSNDRYRATHAGCDIFVWKPCLPAALLGLVRRLRFRSLPAHAGGSRHNHLELRAPRTIGDAIAFTPHRRHH